MGSPPSFDGTIRFRSVYIVPFETTPKFQVLLKTNQLSPLGSVVDNEDPSKGFGIGVSTYRTSGYGR